MTSEFDLEYRVLRNLLADSRQSMEKLGWDLGVSRQVVARIVRKLQNNGTIRKYAVLVNNSAYQTYFIEFKTNPREPEIAESLALLANVSSLDGIIGDFSLFAKIVAKDQVEFAETLAKIDKFMAQSRFQYYRVINTIACFKDCGEITPNASTFLLNEVEERLLNKIRYTSKKIKVSEIGADPKLHLSQPALSKKLDKFLRDGTVRKYTLCVNPAFLKLQTKFILRIKPLRLDQYNEIALQIANNFQEVLDLYRTGEDLGLLAIVRTSDIPTYNAFLRKLYETVEVEDTHSIVVIEERMPAILPILIKP